MQHLFFLLKRMKSQVSEEAEPIYSRISHEKMAAVWTPQLLYKLGSRRGKKCIFLSSYRRLPKTETQTERRVLGEVMGPGSAAGTLRSPKTSSSDPRADPGAEPIPARRFGLNGFALQLWMFKCHWAECQRQETCRDLAGIAGSKL